LKGLNELSFLNTTTVTGVVQLREDEAKLLEFQRELASLFLIGVADYIEVLGPQVYPLVFSKDRRRRKREKRKRQRDSQNR
jgi:hypothetical protein